MNAPLLAYFIEIYDSLTTVDMTEPLTCRINYLENLENLENLLYT